MNWFLLAAYSIKATEIGVPTSTANIGAGFANIVRIMMAVIGMLAIVFLIVGGIQLAYSQGNSKRVQTGRETVIYAIVGLVVSIAAFAIVTFITGAVK